MKIIKNKQNKNKKIAIHFQKLIKFLFCAKYCLLSLFINDFLFNNSFFS